MITQEENNLLTKTGKGTPCGDLMRRYWQPAALSDELTVDQPLPVTIFGEEMILFRDGAGKPALIGRYCAHQGVDMIYGRVEPDGLRCMYHGWLFDQCGKVLLRGEWVPGGERRWDVGQPAYPCVEAGGVIFTYMGPGDPPVLLPYEFLAKPPANDALTKVVRAQNYLRGITDREHAARHGAGFVMPNLVASQGSRSGANNWVRWHVAVDDNSHVEYTVRYVGESPCSGEPQGFPHEELLEGIERIRAEREALPRSTEKDL